LTSNNRYTLAEFVRFCRELRVESGEPFVLEPFQRTMLADHFDGVTEIVIVIPKKNGKTTLLAALALFHLEVWPEAECVIGASTRDQARILHKQAAGLVRRSKLEHRFDVKSGYGEIRRPGGRKDGPRVRVLAADVMGADGVIPTLALVDELHRHPSGDLYGVFRDGLGPREGRMITISTAGATMDSPLGVLRRMANELEGMTRDPESKHSFAQSPDRDFVLHEWSLTDGDDVHDMATVAAANPASWQTEQALRRRHDSPSMTPWQWLRFACGIWTEGDEPWIEPGMWDGLLEPGLEIEPADPAWVAVDLGVRKDSTAVVTVSSRPDGRFAVKARIVRPPEGGLPLKEVEALVREVCEGLGNLQAVVYDPWGFRPSAELLESEGLPIMDFPQSHERMANASANLYRMIEAGELVHDGDPTLRAHVMAGSVKNTERGWRLVKDPKLSRPIDGLIALAMAAFPAASVAEGAFPQAAFA
jgi:phage terminase large subunit-like protein